MQQQQRRRHTQKNAFADQTVVHEMMAERKRTKNEDFFVPLIPFLIAYFDLLFFWGLKLKLQFDDLTTMLKMH